MQNNQTENMRDKSPWAVDHSGEWYSDLIIRFAKMNNSAKESHKKQLKEIPFQISKVKNEEKHDRI